MVEYLVTELFVTAADYVQQVRLDVHFYEHFHEEVELLYFEELQIVYVDDFFFEEIIELFVISKLMQILEENEEHLPF